MSKLLAFFHGVTSYLYFIMQYFGILRNAGNLNFFSARSSRKVKCVKVRKRKGN